MQNNPTNMQQEPYYENVILEIDEYLKNQIQKAQSFGIKNIVLDEYKSLLSYEETKTLEFLERTNIDDILDNDDFFKKLEDLK